MDDTLALDGSDTVKMKGTDTAKVTHRLPPN